VLGDGSAAWRLVAIETALAIAELGLHDDPPDRASIAPLAELVRELQHDAARVDVVFTGHQLVAAHALSHGDADVAASSLRAAVTIAKAADSPVDEVHARLALASALVALERIDEASHHVARAKQVAAARGLRELEAAALLADAAVLGNAGKTAAALDRVLELARAAAADNDASRYVAAVGIMAELYARAGDHASAYRTIVESHHALEAATGSDATPMFRPLLARLRDRVGDKRLLEIGEAVERANRLAEELAKAKA
jgi:hypothetical protein